MTSPHNANPLPANNNRAAARKNNVEGVKLLLTTLSLTATIGLWQLFANSSNQAAPVEKPQAAPPQSVQVVGLPTLVPIVGHAVPQSGQQQAAVLPPVPVLREVGQPASRPAVQRPRPGIEVIMSAPANNPVTNTGSSR